MSSSTSSGGVAQTGQVLGASTSVPAALGATAPAVLGATTAAILPITGNNPIVIAFVIICMAIAGMVLLSFVASRIIRKFI
ncbi:MAG TPA: hypothetical protein VHQ41_04145 [Patescibacteria group bacterium]|jgi:hypothetical protein|nr:hypothetical protein [Patescibacteria group bacterium]